MKCSANRKSDGEMHNLSQFFQLFSLCLFLLLMPIHIYADQEEDDFIEAFGNDNATSGIWQEARAIASDVQKLSYLCQQAHRQMGLGSEDVITKVKLGTRILSFHNYNQTTNRQPITVDVVSYGIERMPDSLWYITKGTKSYCIFYLMFFDAVGDKFRLGLEICGIHVPIPAITT